jgi:hypothetical protein
VQSESWGSAVVEWVDPIFACAFCASLVKRAGYTDFLKSGISMANTDKNHLLSALLLLVLPCVGFAETLVGLDMMDVDSGLTSPAGNYRWLDSADQAYAVSYQTSYDYTQASVHINYYTNAEVLHGTLTATNLKPNFTYQFKVTASPSADMTTIEGIGLSGRWWQEEWAWDYYLGYNWANGWNLNNKGDGSSPNPNDNVYYSRRDQVDLASPTGLHYRYTPYRLLDYFITDADGNASLSFQADSSHHVVFKTTQRSRTSSDGPVKTATFDADPASAAYDTDYAEATVGVFGEWERLPVGGIFFSPGAYHAQFLLTEESFHGSGLAGGWAAAMGGEVVFTIVTESEPVCEFNLPGDLNDDCKVDAADFATMAKTWLVDCNSEPSNPVCVPK